MVIRKIGKRTWRLYSKKSHKNLGTYHSLNAVQNREKQVEFFKFKTAHPNLVKRRYT